MGRRRTNPGDSRLYFHWLRNAHEDIAVAELLVDQDHCRNACAFHCQQCIEKALKAYLLLTEGNLTDGHNLTWLCKRALRYDHEFRKWLDESALLGRYYVETRYPADIPLRISRERIAEIYGMAQDMYAFICEQVIEQEEQQKKKDYYEELGLA